MLSSDEDNLFVICQSFHSSLHALLRLISKNNNVNARDANQDTPLHHCVKSNRLEYVQHLLQAGAYPDIANKEGDTPLHIAVKQQSKDMINLLANAGASFEVENKKGVTPQDLALACEDDKFKEWFQFHYQRLSNEACQAPSKNSEQENANLLLQQSAEEQQEIVHRQINTIQQLQHQLSLYQGIALEHTHTMPNTSSLPNNDLRQMVQNFHCFQPPAREQESTKIAIEIKNENFSQITPNRLL